MELKYLCLLSIGNYNVLLYPIGLKPFGHLIKSIRRGPSNIIVLGLRTLLLRIRLNNNSFCPKDQLTASLTGGGRSTRGLARSIFPRHGRLRSSAAVVSFKALGALQDD